MRVMQETAEVCRLVLTPKIVKKRGCPDLDVWGGKTVQYLAKTVMQGD